VRKIAQRHIGRSRCPRLSLSNLQRCRTGPAGRCRAIGVHQPCRRRRPSQRL